ncbi:MAG: hypothetical protein ABH828_02260 [archaeon]
MRNKIIRFLGVAFVFLAGIITGLAVGPVHFDENIPTAQIIKETADDVLKTINPLSMGAAPEQPSPSDWIQENQIEVYSDHVIIDIKNAEWAMFTNTNSMDPVFDEDSHALELVPQTEAEIQVGDIVSYESDYAEGTIIHRVIYKGQDEEGVYFVMKGDNNPASDPGKVRFEQIERVLVAIFY